MSDPSASSGGEPRIRSLEIGTEIFTEIPGELLRRACRKAVIECTERVPRATFDVAVRAKRGARVLTDGEDERWLAQGIFEAYEEVNSASAIVPANAGWRKVPRGLRTPAGVEVKHDSIGDPHAYEVGLLITSGGSLRGRLFQETKATLNPQSWEHFIRAQILPALADSPRPFRLALAVGGTSAEESLAMAARADAGSLDGLGEVGDESGSPIRDPELEQELSAMLEVELGTIDAPACAQVRVIRLVRHGGSLPIGMYVGHPDDQRCVITIKPGTETHYIGKVSKD